MKVKRKKRLRDYLGGLLLVCFIASLFIDEFFSFFLGFFQGFFELEEEEAIQQYGDLSRTVGGVALVVVVIILLFVFRKFRRKVTEPIEQLAAGMERVSQGELDVKVPTDGDFEFGEIQQTFNRMVEELAKARKAKELQEQQNQQLYAGIAHDLKTPMTMIMGYAKVLESNRNLPEEDKMRYLQTIVEQTQQANNLLDSLLTYAKLENPAYALIKEKKDLAEILRSCVAGFYPTMESNGIEVELDIPDRNVEFSVDELQMRRVFLNLLTNMVKHNPVGTKCKIVMEENVELSQEDRGIRVTIADNGPKITGELQERLFETFAVGDSSRNTKNGSGLGLSICKKIVEKHEGRIFYMNEWEEEYKAFVIELVDKKYHCS